jgi:hypothetical protein
MRKLASALVVLLGLVILASPSRAIAQDASGDLEFFVEPQQVVIAHEGIFALHGGHLLKISHLQCMNKGLLATVRGTDRSAILEGGVIQAVEVCHGCGQLRFGPVCTNPQCPYYGNY